MAGSEMAPPVWTLPNILTLGRIVAVPLLVLAFFSGWPVVAFILFAVASVTDWLDGYLARKWRQESALGKLMDPIADKVLVVSALFMLVAFGHIGEVGALAAVVILAREFLVSGLREVMADYGIKVNVSVLAKWKTTVQMVAIALLILAPPSADGFVAVAGLVLLWISAALAAITAVDYCRGAARAFSDRHAAPGGEGA